MRYTAVQNASLAGSDKNATEEDDIWTVVEGKRHIYSQSKGLQNIPSSSNLPTPQKTTLHRQSCLKRTVL